MSTVGGQQRKRSQASRVGSSMTMRSTTTAQPTRANSIAVLPSSAQLNCRSDRNANRSCGACGCGTAGHKRVSTEVWDPFQFDCMKPGGRSSSRDLLQAINQQRRAQSQNDAGRSPSCRPQPPPRNCCYTGESDSAVSDKGRRTAEFVYDMWCQQKLCDVVLRCCGDENADDTILAHKVRYTLPEVSRPRTRPEVSKPQLYNIQGQGHSFQVNGLTPLSSTEWRWIVWVSSIGVPRAVCDHPTHCLRLGRIPFLPLQIFKINKFAAEQHYKKLIRR